MGNPYNIQFVKRVIQMDFKAAGPIGHNAIDETTETTFTGYLRGLGGVVEGVVQIPSVDVADLQIANWNAAYGWGNHANAGYLTSESDPVVGAVNGLVKADGLGNISSAVAGTDYLATGGWYDADQNTIDLSGFNDDLSYENPLTFGTGLSRVGDTVTNDITQYTDSDAVAAIKADAAWNATEWDTAFGWGDHSAAGYLTSVNIGDINATGTPSSSTYLRGDGTWSSVPSGDISGTIAAGQVAFGTGADTIGGDNGLYWDNVNKRFGVGTSSPASLFHLDGVSGSPSTARSLFTIRNSASNIGFQIGAESTQGWIRAVHVLVNHTRWGILGLGDNFVTLGSGGDPQQVYMDTENKRVGFGTTTPDEKVDVNGNVKASGYKSGTETGQTTTATVVTDVRQDGTQLQKKTQLLTYTGGLLTAKAAESAWTNTTDI